MSQARALDQFYTSRQVAKDCFQILKNEFVLLDDDVFLEPSAGDGAFFELFPPGRREGCDLEPKHSEVVKANFLTEFQPNSAVQRWICCGNPPFGKNSSLAVQFFNRAAEFCEVIAFIVPLTFRKSSLQKRLNRYFELVSDTTLEELAFVFEEQPYSVPCCFQVWVKKNKPRRVVSTPLSHPDFEFCSRDEGEFAIRRVGGLAGKVIESFKGYSPSSHYYIKSVDTDITTLKRRMQAIDWNDVKWNTAGNPSISKRELVAKYAEQQ